MVTALAELGLSRCPRGDASPPAGSCSTKGTLPTETLRSSGACSCWHERPAVDEGLRFPVSILSFSHGQLLPYGEEETGEEGREGPGGAGPRRGRGIVKRVW